MTTNLTDPINELKIEERTAEYLRVLTENSPASYDFVIYPGRKYNKVVMTYNGGARSVHAFIEAETGAVLKAEGWAKPAKGVRFSLLGDASYRLLLHAAAQKQAFAGGYLYYR